MIQAQDLSGNSIQFTSEPAFLLGDKLVSVDEDENYAFSDLPITYSLSANYPNPFNPVTNL
ncbi:MAG: hypothetical protein P8Y79_06840 [Ignavibacteriaceae bacterium]